MPKLFADNTADIDAPASLVWDVLTKNDYGNRWAFDFAQLHIESDWEFGSLVLWKKDDGTVAVEGKVIALEPQKLLRFTVIDTSNPQRELARSNDDGITFELSEQNGMTTLHVLHGDFSVLEDAEQALQGTMESWGKVLPQIKALTEWILKLEQEGFTDLRVCPIPPNKDLPEHTHDDHTVHVVLDGKLIITDHGNTETFQPGDRVDFPAGTTHKARGSIDFGKMIIGIKATSQT